MAKTLSQKTREEIALDFAKSSGVAYLNPFIGGTSAETCGNLDDGFSMLHYFMSRSIGDETQPGLALLVRAMWTAVQFEKEVAERREGGEA